jgi:hypothetical protein
MFRTMELLSIGIDDLQGMYEAQRGASGKENTL